ncbi:hypothetical protein LDO31_17900 [Luteimonas sp. XNQY3]|nr:hypothetical protein [Luteimonas sp. XNQY3]MCD9008073.1 hypothetical protein [Luteimonas sp. XNQY3]
MIEIGIQPSVTRPRIRENSRDANEIRERELDIQAANWLAGFAMAAGVDQPVQGRSFTAICDVAGVGLVTARKPVHYAVYPGFGMAVKYNIGNGLRAAFEAHHPLQFHPCPL